MSETSKEHRKGAPKQVNFVILTISTSRYTKKETGQDFTNPSADLASSLLMAAGHLVIEKELVSDDLIMLRSSLTRLSENPLVQSIITLGGTGITPTDVTIEAVSPLFDKELPGFGEIFRKLSYDQIGTATILTRCTAGLIRGKCVFCLPGSPQAVETALKALVIPEIGHILAHARE
jgi:molybdenum cofactor biosynthesis protein B